MRHSHDSGLKIRNITIFYREWKLLCYAAECQREQYPLLGSSSVFDMPQAQLSMWGCDYILLENERRFQVYCSGCRVHPDAFQSNVGKHSSNICEVEACLWWPRCAGMAGGIWPGWRPFCPLTCSATLWFPDSTNNVATCIDRSRYMPLTVLVQYLHLY